MKIHLTDMVISLKQGPERIEFVDFNYFYGQMGAGKSTIARLIDYCFGGDLDVTPALQTEFVSASLSLTVEDSPLILERDANATGIKARFTTDKQPFEIMIPARVPGGEVLIDTGVEVLSDLIYYLAGKTPPKVRRSKIKEDSELTRLSIRDLLWYCYLDQETIDSSFFHLEGDANHYKRLKSRDVLRFIVGFHQERVSELEVELETIRTERLRCEAGASAVADALSEAEVATEAELIDIRKQLEEELKNAEKAVSQARAQTDELRPHAMESLRTKARNLAFHISSLLEAQDEIKNAISKDKSHINELLSLGTRFRRSQSAREILGGVAFEDCPRCGRDLPNRPSDECPVCGQLHDELPTGVIAGDAAEQDLESRVADLKSQIELYETEFKKTERLIREVNDEKGAADEELNRASVAYDSAYLSVALEAERQRAGLKQQLLDLNRLDVLVRRIAELSERASKLLVAEQEIRSQLKEARTDAEKDTDNLKRLKELFLDCLLRAKIPGFLPTDIVEMKPPHFLPEVTPVEGDLAVISFANMGSGGKKTLYKSCFAVAIHRLSAEIGAMLPTFMIIDSPMKNISERENSEQFEGFHNMLYELCSNELRETQFILIDKEYSVPPEDFQPTFRARHMQPDSVEHPPLIPYYKGK